MHLCEVLCISGSFYITTTLHSELNTSCWSGWQWFFMPTEGGASGLIHCKIFALRLFIKHGPSIPILMC
jgi:hypothetical protein